MKQASFIYKKQPQVFNSFPVWQKVLPGEEGYEDVGGVTAAQISKTGESVNSTVKDVQVSYSLRPVLADRCMFGLFLTFS